MDGAAVRGMAIRVGRMPGPVIRDGAIAAVMVTATASFAADIIQGPRFMVDIMEPRRFMAAVDSTAARSTAEADFTAAVSVAAIAKN
jgi:hypothetical protein